MPSATSRGGGEGEGEGEGDEETSGEQGDLPAISEGDSFARFGEGIEHDVGMWRRIRNWMIGKGRSFGSAIQTLGVASHHPGDIGRVYVVYGTYYVHTEIEGIL